jgi:hypothetical protein
VLSEQRLAELFPQEQRASVGLLVGLLTEPIAALGGAKRKKAGEAGDLAGMVYQLTFAALRTHLVAGTRPDARGNEALVGFCLRGATP